jgi:hypothetical protein
MMRVHSPSSANDGCLPELAVASRTAERRQVVHNGVARIRVAFGETPEHPHEGEATEGDKEGLGHGRRDDRRIEILHGRVAGGFARCEWVGESMQQAMRIRLRLCSFCLLRLIRHSVSSKDAGGRIMSPVGRSDGCVGYPFPPKRPGVDSSKARLSVSRKKTVRGLSSIRRQIL